MGTAFAAVPISVCGLKSQFNIVSRVLFILLADGLFYVSVKAVALLCGSGLEFGLFAFFYNNLQSVISFCGIFIFYCS